MPPHMQQNRQGQRSVSSEGTPLTQQQLQQQHLRQQQLTQMQQKNFGTENHHPNGRYEFIYVYTYIYKYIYTKYYDLSMYDECHFLYIIIY
jgi:hypothetical protein